jgi:hypothetical protein
MHCHLRRPALQAHDRQPSRRLVRMRHVSGTRSATTGAGSGSGSLCTRALDVALWCSYLQLYDDAMCTAVWRHVAVHRQVAVVA